MDLLRGTGNYGKLSRNDPHSCCYLGGVEVSILGVYHGIKTINNIIVYRCVSDEITPKKHMAIFRGKMMFFRKHQIWGYHLFRLTVGHGKIHHEIKNGKPSISIRAIYTIANC